MFSQLNKNILIIILIISAISVGIFLTLKKKEVVIVIPPEQNFKQEVIGHSVQGRNIEAYSYGTGKNHLIFVGGIHGGYEWNSVSLAYTFIDYIDRHKDIIPKNLTIDIIPSSNPDGLYKVTGKDGRFATADVSTDENILASGRFNANNVDINRNFDCKWKSESTWRSKTVSAGTSPFSEPESKAIQNFILKTNPSSVVFWHSQSNAVYASQCEDGLPPETLTLMNTYAQASGYDAVKFFDAYPVTGAVEDWLAKINIPAITVELKTHDSIDWDKNLAGIKAVISYYGK